MEQGAIIGKGIVFPLELTPQGGVVVATGNKLLRSAIAITLTWSFGTRFFLQAFGARLHELLDEPNDLITQNLVRRFVEEALTIWEKRITLLDAKMHIGNNSKSINLLVSYLVKESGQIEQIIYPFKM